LILTKSRQLEAYSSGSRFPARSTFMNGRTITPKERVRITIAMSITVKSQKTQRTGRRFAKHIFAFSVIGIGCLLNAIQ
jgi:hypothetical protein